VAPENRSNQLTREMFGTVRKSRSRQKLGLSQLAAANDKGRLGIDPEVRVQSRTGAGLWSGEKPRSKSDGAKPRWRWPSVPRYMMRLHWLAVMSLSLALVLLDSKMFRAILPLLAPCCFLSVPLANGTPGGTHSVVDLCDISCFPTRHGGRIRQGASVCP
jgi:hypothetical protein